MERRLCVPAVSVELRRPVFGEFAMPQESKDSQVNRDRQQERKAFRHHKVLRGAFAAFKRALRVVSKYEWVERRCCVVECTRLASVEGHGANMVPDAAAVTAATTDATNAATTQRYPRDRLHVHQRDKEE